MKRFFVYGCGGLGCEIIVTVDATNKTIHQWDEIRFIVDDEWFQETSVNGYEVWRFSEYLEKGILATDRFIIASGEAIGRQKMEEKLRKYELKLGSVIHENNQINAGIELGEGVVIQQLAAPGPRCKIGRCVLLQGMSILGHDVEIGDYSTISSFAFVGGGTKIGKGTYIAPGAMIRDNIVIGDNCIIGMGSVVTKDIPDNSVAFGNPCKVTRENANGVVFRK